MSPATYEEIQRLEAELAAARGALRFNEERGLRENTQSLRESIPRLMAWLQVVRERGTGE